MLIHITTAELDRIQVELKLTDNDLFQWLKLPGYKWTLVDATKPILGEIQKIREQPHLLESPES